MAIAQVVCRGLGPGGSVGWLVTHGFGPAAAAHPVTPGGWFVAPDMRQAQTRGRRRVADVEVPAPLEDTAAPAVGVPDAEPEYAAQALETERAVRALLATRQHEADAAMIARQLAAELAAEEDALAMLLLLLEL